MHGLLREQGLLRFYELGGRDLGAVGAVPRAAALEWLPELEARHASADGSVCLTLDVQGIRCAACVWLLQEVYRRLPGARALRLCVSLGRATLVYDRAASTAAAFVARAAAFGYPMAPPTRRPARSIGLLVRLGITAALAMNAMILAFAQYCGLAADGGALDRLFGWVGGALATASVLVGGPVFFRGALAGLRSGMLHMDLPISLGILLAYGGSVAGLLQGGAIYFDTVAIFVALMVAGRFLQERSLRRNKDQLLADDGAEHLRVRRIRAGGLEVVPVAAVAAGDELLLAPGDLLPVRARLRTRGSLSLDWISGESEPRSFEAGDDVPAGAFVAGRTALRATATADYPGSGVAELLQQPAVDREHLRGRVRFWDRLARWYSLGVLCAAAFGAALWWRLDPSRALPVAVAVLVITCPCAFGIASPLAFHLTLAGLRRRGVFVRTQGLLDKVRRVRKVIFDKTGTVTFGGLRASPVLAPDAALRPVLATLAASSNHPASQAVLAVLGNDAGFDPDLVVEEQPGRGVAAHRDGIEYRLGSAAFCGVEPSAERECVFGAGGEVLARYRLDEDYRDGARAELDALRQRGLDVHLLSGDRPERVAAAATLLGFEPARAHGGMQPADKAAYVQRLDADDTMMIGDGLNDAPAFAAAWCAGTPAMDRPVMPARSDFFFRGARAGAVADLFDRAAAYHRVVRQNLALAIAYNTAALTLCLFGLMTPLLCAVLMPLSSIALVSHTGWRLGRRDGP